jgi:hypothetical protein
MPAHCDCVAARMLPILVCLAQDLRGLRGCGASLCAWPGALVPGLRWGTNAKTLQCGFFTAFPSISFLFDGAEGVEEGGEGGWVSGLEPEPALSCEFADEAFSGEEEAL